MTVSIPHRIEVENEAQPATLSALLRELGLKQASIEKQKPALRAWLASHPANKMLRVSMQCNGYGLLLKEDTVARN
ncbi:hypothetical protein [Mycobacterium sp. MMS18-G62]